MNDDSDWLVERASRERWGVEQWARWTQMRRRFESLRVDLHFSAAGAGTVSAAGSGHGDEPELTIRSPLDPEEEFPLLAALGRLMNEVAQERERQVRRRLDGNL